MKDMHSLPDLEDRLKSLEKEEKLHEEAKCTCNSKDSFDAWEKRKIMLGIMRRNLEQKIDIAKSKLMASRSRL